MQTTLKEIVTLTPTDQLLFALQDGEWHSLNEFAYTINNGRALHSSLTTLRSQGYTIQSRRPNENHIAKEYRLLLQDDAENHFCDVVDVAILGRLYKYSKCNKIVKGARIYLDICDKMQLDQAQVVFAKLKKLRHQKYVRSIRKRSSNDKEALYWKVLPKGIKLLHHFAEQKVSF